MTATLAKTPDELEVVSRYRETAPVDLDALAADLGLNVVYSDELGPDIAGMIKRDERRGGASGYVIYVNGDDPHRRRRFTLAHEIGHFLLHRDLMDSGIVDDRMYRSPLGAWYERQANRFAADLLLPSHLVRDEFRGGNKSLAGLSNKFDVSDQAMRIRLDELRLSA